MDNETVKKASEITAEIIGSDNTKTISLSKTHDVHIVYEDINITLMLIKHSDNKMEKTRTVNRYEAEHVKTVIMEYLEAASKKKFLGLF